MEDHVLSGYIGRALARAAYKKLEDGTYAGRITCCPGVVALRESLRSCEDELQSALEDWILVGLKRGQQLPVIDGLDLNKGIEREPLEAML